MVIMKIHCSIADFLSSPKKRNVSIILILAVIFLLVIRWNCSPTVAHVSPGIMVCGECEYRQQLRTDEKLKCPKCGKDMGSLWKCMACRYEFGYLPPNTKGAYDTEEALRRTKIESHRCPNCGSEETFPVTVLNMPEKAPTAVK
jgi:predicted RNA-binding Zn-ribbon protein involved in translation (DUF1610 family)